MSRKRVIAPRGAVVLSPSGDMDDFSTMDLVVGLHGVCQALDDQVGTESLDRDGVHRLSIAANVLSSMVMQRMETAPFS
ncbi:MAG TPA: hypothetical protein VGO37_06120 [Steroidobacteraceae bacterium]|jgi:hypothetical protein|nr:hypothetical protein [Steroidobacteraceae bacterium]